MHGHGIAVGGDNFFKGYFEEHGVVMGILSVIPRTTYQDGVPRWLTRSDRFDFAIPAMAHLGEQTILNRELYFDPTTSGDDPTNTFGYQQRYAEYKYNPGQVCGEFRTTLDDWHLGRIFGSEPALNEEFIDCEPDEVSRIFASGEAGTDKLWAQIYFSVRADRPLP